MPDLFLSISALWSRVSRPYSLARARGFAESGTNMIDNTQNVGTSWEAITMGDVGAGGYVYLENLDTTNFVQVRQGTDTTPFGRLEPFDVSIFRVDDGASLQAQANTAACEVLVVGWDP